MSDSTATSDNPDDKKPPEDSAGEVSDVDEEDDHFVVEEITDLRITKGGKLEFCVRWQSDNSISWEPIESFPNEYDHEEIVRYKNSNPEKYEKLLTASQNAKQKKKPKSHRNWTYVDVTKETEEQLYEKPVSDAAREIKCLSDPNRLKDDQEEYLKSFDGVRISRNAVRQIKEGRVPSTESSRSSTATSTPVAPEKKKRAPGGGRKKKAESSEASSSVTSSSTSSQPPIAKTPSKRGRKPKPKVPVPAAPSPAPVQEEEKEEGEAAQPAQPSIGGSLADGIDDWRPQRRDVKLNSSDSDSDDEVFLPPSAQKKKKSPAAPSPTPPAPPRRRSKPQASEENKAAPKRTREVMEQAAPAVVDVPAAPYVTPPEDVYDSDKEDEYVNRANVELFGLQKFRGDWEEHFKKQDEAHLNSLKSMDLNKAIEALDASTAEGIMERLDRTDTYNIVKADPFQLHYSIQHHNKDRSRDLERTVRTVLHYLPIDILSSTDKNKNTILNCAIISNHERLVKYLIDIGSPLDIKNVNGMSAVQSANITGNPEILRMVLMRGGMFHYLLKDYKVCVPYNRDRDYFDNKISGERREALLKVVNEVYGEIDNLCLRHRSHYQPQEFDTREFGPIITLPRGKLRDNGWKFTVNFRFPQIPFDHNHKFMLAMIPIQYCPVEKRLAVKIPGVRMAYPPGINRLECYPFSNRTQNPTYFDCTRNVLEQLRHPKNWATRNSEFPGNNPVDVDDMRTTFILDVQVDHMEQYDFLACQVFRVEKWDNFPRPSSNYSNDQQRPRSPGPIRRAGTPSPNQQSRWNPNQHQQNGSHQQQRPVSPYPQGPPQRAPYQRNNNFNNNHRFQQNRGPPNGPPNGPNNYSQNPRVPYNRPNSSGPSSSSNY